MFFFKQRKSLNDDFYFFFFFFKWNLIYAEISALWLHINPVLYHGTRILHHSADFVTAARYLEY